MPRFFSIVKRSCTDLLLITHGGTHQSAHISPLAKRAAHQYRRIVADVLDQGFHTETLCCITTYTPGTNHARTHTPTLHSIRHLLVCLHLLLNFPVPIPLRTLQSRGGLQSKECAAPHRPAVATVCIPVMPHVHAHTHTHTHTHIHIQNKNRNVLVEFLSRDLSGNVQPLCCSAAMPQPGGHMSYVRLA
jgi:hypothetical protein